MNIVLYGCKAVGKTTTGAALAKRLQIPHLDSDYHLERKYNKTISTIYQELGEDEFRKAEQAAVIAIASAKSSVLSLGGGSLIDPFSRKALFGSLFFHLFASPEYLWTRLETPSPLFSGKSDFIQLCEKRVPLYRAWADHEVDIEGKSAEEIAEIIAKKRMR